MEGTDAHKVFDQSFWAGRSIIHKKPAAGMATSEQGPTGRSEGHIGHGGLCRPDDWKTATKGRRREAVLVKQVAIATHARGVTICLRHGSARRAIRSNRTSAESAANVAVDVGPIDWAGRVFNRDVAWMLMKIVIGVRMARLCLLKATHALACRSRSWPTTCDAKL